MQRQRAKVAQQHAALGGQLGGQPVVRGAVKRGGPLRQIRRQQDDVQDAGHGAVQHGLVQRAAAHGVDEPAVVDPLRAGHLQLKTGGNALDTVVHRAPVGHDKAVKAPCPAQNVGQQRLVLARIGTVEPVVAAHHGPWAGLFHGGLKGGQIDLLQGALVHTAVYRQAAGLLIVGGKMLDACAYALALHTVDEPCGQLTGKVGVLGVVFKIAAAQGAALDVDGRPQQDLHAVGAGLPPEGGAHAAGQRRVKGCGCRTPCREADRLDAVVGVGAALPLGAQAVGAVADLDGRDAQPRDRLGMPEIRAGAKPGLLLQRQCSDKLLHSRVHVGSPLKNSMCCFPHYNTHGVENKRKKCKIIAVGTQPGHNPAVYYPQRREKAMNHILIAEDEHLIARLVEMTLTRAGYRCTVAEDGRTAADLIEKTDFDMAILDIMLPGLDGYELLASLKPQGVPVIFLTAKSAVKDRVLGLRLGADDYITKPFAAEELVARMETVLRRTGRGGRELRAFDIRLDTQDRTAWRGEEPLDLRRREFDLLELLMRNRGAALYRDVIFSRVWGGEPDSECLRTVDTHIARLRKKLGWTTEQLETIYRVGYRLKKE